MADNLSSARRSENMRRIRSADTKPEIVVRRAVYGLGYRYRLHGRSLPGRPDLVLTRQGKVIFVHGCFWHQHARCIDGHVPRTNEPYWGPKLARNTERDRENLRSLRKLGWKCLVVWECETGNLGQLIQRLTTFLRRGFLPSPRASR